MGCSFGCSLCAICAGKCYELFDGVSGGPGFAAIGSLLKQHAGRAEFGVGGELVLDVGDAAILAVAAEQFHRAKAILAAKFCVFIHQGDGDVFDLPVGLIPPAGFDPASSDFALIHLFAFDCHTFYCPVPPTVMRSSLMVGMPTPTGTLCPALPHVPMPSSRARSFPTIDTYLRASGPLPIRVAPLTGRVTLPSSMR